MTNPERTPYSITLGELAALGREHIPEELRTDTQLIYNSPAALDFNSPGAQGFGVKRAGLALPGSIMLLISPACCGRNTSALSAPPDMHGESYGERFAYLQLDENDIVTGRHLSKIPAAVQAFIQSRPQPPTIVLLCLTCVDALLGTDMERIARKASAHCGLPVRPCYMYALTRDSIRPPMVAVRQMLYSLLEPLPKNPRACNILGFFSPLSEDSELFTLLEEAGLEHIREISRCGEWQDYLQMAEANFNLVLNPEAVPAAQEMAQRLSIPFAELKRLYEPDKIERQYQGLARILQTDFDTSGLRNTVQTTAEKFAVRFGKQTVLGVGSRLNGNSFELSLALVRLGLKVSEIYALPQPADFFYIKELAKLSPETRLFTNLSLSMAFYREEQSPVNLALGADAAYYHPHAGKVLWNEETQPFGYQAVLEIFKQMEAACS